MYSYKILQNWSKDMFHSSVLTFEKKSYLFNCSDGTQRNLSSQNVKFSKISHVFFNSASIDAYLGSYGFSMSRNEQVGKMIPSESNEEEGKKAKGKNSEKKAEAKNSNEEKVKENVKENEENSSAQKDYKIKSYLVPLMENSGKPLYFWGPPPLRSNFDHCNYFFVERVKDYVYEYNPITRRFELKLFNKKELMQNKNLINNNNNYLNTNSINQDNLNDKQINLSLTEPDLILDFFEDENLKIYPIFSAAPMNNNNSHNNKNTNKNYDFALSYFCEPHLRTRSFLPEKAKALGLKPGPAYAQLQNGQSVFLNGKEIKPEDVLGDQMPSSCIAILYSPTLAHAKNLLENLKAKNFFEKTELKTISVVVHILGDSSILNCFEYKSLISEITNLHQDVLHIIDCKDTNYKFMLNEEKHKIKYLLAQADQKSYKIGHFDEKETLPYVNLNEFFEIELLENGKSVINSNAGFEFNLYPVHKRRVVSKKIYEPFIFDKKNSKFASFVKQADNLLEEHRKSANWEFDCNKKDDLEIINKLNENLINLNHQHDTEMKIEHNEISSEFKNEPEIMFLGTSSMKPGLFRNVSSVFVKLSEKYNNYNLLLDCGEGSYQQLHNYFGEQKTNEILDKMKIIFLSHKHGDHMLGTLKVILEIDKIKRQKQSFSYDSDRVYIIAPKTVSKWIKKNIKNESAIILKDLFIFIDNSQINQNISSVYFIYALQDNPYVGFSDVQLELSEEFLEAKSKAYFNFISKRAKAETENPKINNSDLNSINIDNYSSGYDSETSEAPSSTANTNILQQKQTKENIFFSKSECVKLLEFHRYTQENLGLNFHSIEVFHCDESYGCFLEHFSENDFSLNSQNTNPVKKRIWKISYSGDTRPCNNFHNFAAYSSLFIHEATFDDELVQDAREKMHSTIDEAIRLGKSCNSWRIALTHFSPRYIKLMPFKNVHMEERVVFVNDYFALKLSEFVDAYKTGGRIATLLEAASEKQIL